MNPSNRSSRLALLAILGIFIALGEARTEPLIVYAAETQASGPFGLFWTNTGGATKPLAVQGPFGSAANVLEYDFALQDSTLVYRASSPLSGTTELFQGGTYWSSPGARINPPLPAGRSVTHYALSKNTSSIAYIADADSAGVFEAYVSRLNGTLAPQKVNSVPVSDGNVLDIGVSPDGKWTAYRGDLLAEGKFEIFASAIPTTSTWRINDPLAANEDVISFAISPDSSRAAFLVNRSFGAAGLRHRLYTRAIQGTGPIVPVADTGTSDGDVVDYKYSTFGGKIALLEDRDTSGQFELYLVNSNGSGGVAKINAAMAPDKDVQKFAFSPDGQWLAYESNVPGPAAAQGELFLYSVSGGGVPTKVNQDASGNAGDFAFSPDSRMLIYQQAPLGSGVFDLYARPTNLGAAEHKVNGVLSAGRSIDAFAIGANSEQVAYIGDLAQQGDVFLARLDGSGAERKVNPAGQTAAAVLAAPIDLKAAANGSWPLYR